MRLSDIEVWAVNALSQVGATPDAFASPIKRMGRPTKAEVREAERRGVTVPELRAFRIGRPERGGL